MTPQVARGLARVSAADPASRTARRAAGMLAAELSPPATGLSEEDDVVVVQAADES